MRELTPEKFKEISEYFRRNKFLKYIDDSKFEKCSTEKLAEIVEILKEANEIKENT